jgi:arylsulfatase A-like enzyme
MTTNFIFILADDLGYADLGCYGGREHVSPYLDKMAAEGLRFTQGYSNSPVCSPTRFALMTGRYQYHLRGADEEPLTARYRGNPDVGLPPSHPTLPSILQAAGYSTSLIGKWHLGYPPHFGPLMSGYEEHFGPFSGGVSYFSHLDRGGKHDLVENGEPVKHDGKYLTDLLSERAADYVKARAADQAPFFMSLHYTAPHWPWQTRSDNDSSPEVDKNIVHLDGGSIHTYRQMIREMDEGIGLLFQTLRQTGLDEDTLVIFTSDNGGERFSDNWPLVGGKMDLTEGGIRVPYIVRWPGRIPAGTTSSQQIMTMDWAPTLFDIAGVSPDPAYPLDGISLKATLENPALNTTRKLYWRMNHRNQRALRDGNFKYLAIEDNEYLFDLSADERERANLAQRQPQRLSSMRTQFSQWSAKVRPVDPEARSELVYTERHMPRR